MKVLQVNKYHYVRAGAERYVFDLSRLLESHGHEVVPFAMHHPDNVPTPWSRFFVPERRFDRREGLVKDAEKVATMLWSRDAAMRLRALLREFRPDVAHIHNIYHHLSPSILSVLRREGIPVVWTVHDFKWICPNYKLFTEGDPCERCHVYRYWNAVAHRCVDESRAASAVAAVEMALHRLGGWYERDVARAIAPSAFLRNLLGRWGKDLSKITHLPNLMDAAPLAHIRSTLGDEVVYAGRLSEEKGVARVLELAAALPGTRFRIVGTGPLEAALKKTAGAQDLRNVAFAGFLAGDDLFRAIAAARLVLVPSRWFENFPYAVLEAMALGKTVVASATGGIPEIVEDGISGFLVPPDDRLAWVDTVGRLVQDGDMLAATGERARRRVAAFSPARHYERLMQVYGDVLAR